MLDHHIICHTYTQPKQINIPSDGLIWAVEDLNNLTTHSSIVSCSQSGCFAMRIEISSDKLFIWLNFNIINAQILF